MLDTDYANDIAIYEERIKKLQESVASLRMSRRVLMSLLEQVQTNKKEELEQLLKENMRLHKQVNSYANRLWEKNQRIVELEQAKLS